MPDHAGGVLTLTARELAGDLPSVCARTGQIDAIPTPVWFARSPSWAWLPLAVLALIAVVNASWAPLASWWTFAAILLPLLFSRGVTGRIPLSGEVRSRLAHLRRRRLVTMIVALLLTWVSVGLWLIGSRAGGLLVLGLVITLYLAVVGMFVAGRMIGVGGWPEDDGGATLKRLHPHFIDAVQLRRTGHRPDDAL